MQELDALQNFPLLPRGGLQGKNAFDFLTMPLSSLLRISYMHSGQDEDNVFVHFATNGDIAHHVEQMTRSLVACGLHNAALVGILGDGADSRLMDIHYASEFIGAAVTMLGQDKKKWPQVLDFVTPETLIGTPKRLAELDDILQQKGIICLHASVPSSSLVTSVNDLAPAKVYHMLALPLLGTAAPFLPCEPSKLVFHLQEDYTMAEIIDPATKKPSAGSGELVLTSLAAEAMPVIRLCTGLMVEPAAGPCSCGRTHRRFRLLVG